MNYQMARPCPECGKDTTHQFYPDNAVVDGYLVAGSGRWKCAVCEYRREVGEGLAYLAKLSQVAARDEPPHP